MPNMHWKQDIEKIISSYVLNLKIDNTGFQ